MQQLVFLTLSSVFPSACVCLPAADRYHARTMKSVGAGARGGHYEICVLGHWGSYALGLICCIVGVLFADTIVVALGGGGGG